jgi:hypothetical protein
LDGYLSQGYVEKHTGAAGIDFGSSGCAPTSVVNSLYYLSSINGGVYGNSLGTSTDGPSMAALAITLAGSAYLNWSAPPGEVIKGVEQYDYLWGIYRYMEAKAPNRTAYSAELFSIVWPPLPDGVTPTPGRELPSWASVHANTSGIPGSNPSYPTWQYLLSQLQAKKAVLINWGIINGYLGHYMSLTGIYFNDENSDNFIQETENATITYVDPKGGLKHTAHIWQRGSDGALIIDYGRTVGEGGDYPSGWWYSGPGQINLAMSFGPKVVPFPGVLFLLLDSD